MKHITQLLLASALTTASILSAATTANAHEIKIGNLVIHHPWLKPPLVPTAVGEAFTTIDNKGTQDDVLLKVTVEGVAVVQIHDMKMDGDTMKMSELKEGLVIPAGKSVELKPKTMHIMLEKFKSKPILGEQIKGTFTFAKAGTVDLDFEVTAPNAEAHKH